MHAQLIEKPLILAICGKSASGKDTLAKFLTNYFSSLGLHAHNMVSITTRPPREGEKHSIDYYFVNDKQFKELIENRQLIEFTHFKNWKYGVSLNEVKPGYINIGVFNPEGLKTLQMKKYNYWVIPIYIEENFRLRMRRSYKREHKWKIEFVRRAAADHFDFKDIEKTLKRFRGKYIKLQNFDNLWRQANTIERNLYSWGILRKDENGKIQLVGNFV